MNSPVRVEKNDRFVAWLAGQEVPFKLGGENGEIAMFLSGIMKFFIPIFGGSNNAKIYGNFDGISPIIVPCLGW